MLRRQLPFSKSSGTNSSGTRRSGTNGSGRLVGVLALVAALLAACGAAGADAPSAAPTGGSLTPSATTIPPAVLTPETGVTVDSAPHSAGTTSDPPDPPSSTSAPTSIPVPTTVTPTTIVPVTVPSTTEPIPDPSFAEAGAAFERLAADNTAASMTVIRAGVVVFSQASGTTIDGQQATADSPMLVASVSKLITAFMIARLAEAGRLAIDAPVPWDIIGITPVEAWNDVTVRELLDHTGGMPVARESWFVGGRDCRGALPSLVASPPESHRGQWKYSNGNYCALGLLVEGLTGEALDVAAQHLIFDPLGIDGVHLSPGGLQPGDLPHDGDVSRLTPLGGSGTFIVSTDDLAAMLAATTQEDRDILRPPGIFTDQYGWGHTGTVIGAISCAWVLEAGRTVVVATIAGNSPDKGGGICDRVVPPVANAIGIGRGVPDRTP